MTEILHTYWHWILLGGFMLYWYRDRLPGLTWGKSPAEPVAPPVRAELLHTPTPPSKNTATIVFDLDQPGELDVFHVASSMLKRNNVKATKLIDLSSPSDARPAADSKLVLDSTSKPTT